MSNLPGQYNFISNTGWMCPRCNYVYAPFMMSCTNCNVTTNPNSPVENSNHFKCKIDSYEIKVKE